MTLTYRLAHLSTIRESDDASLQGLHYHYDPVGNITDIRDTAQQTVYFQNAVVEAANSYEYDALYRLIEATGREHASQGTTQRTHEQLPVGPQPMTSDPSAMRRYTQKYTYDSVGNILTMQHIPASGSGWTRYYQYDDAGNRLEATSAPGDDPEGPYTHTYSYDNHGSMTAMPHLSSMIWNHQDELQEVTVGTETVYFQYAGGMRSRKYTEKDGSTTEERIYLGAFEIYRKRVSGTLDLERESLHISDGTGRICIVETKTVDGGSAVGSPAGIWRYQLGNHLGSAATEVDEDGEVISYEEYHPYGTSAYRAVDSSVDVSAKRYRYTGMERDEETSLEYHSARYYAPWLGRWTASDPIGLAGGGNLYLYAAANPVVLADQRGLSPVCARTDTIVQVDESGNSGVIGFGVECRPDPADNVRRGGAFDVGELTPSQRGSQVFTSNSSVNAGALGFHLSGAPEWQGFGSTWDLVPSLSPPDTTSQGDQNPSDYTVSPTRTPWYVQQFLATGRHPMPTKYDAEWTLAQTDPITGQWITFPSAYSSRWTLHTNTTDALGRSVIAQTDTAIAVHLVGDRLIASALLVDTLYSDREQLAERHAHEENHWDITTMVAIWMQRELDAWKETTGSNLQGDRLDAFVQHGAMVHSLMQHYFDSAKSSSGRTISLERYFQLIAKYWAKSDEQLVELLEFAEHSKTEAYRAKVIKNPFVHLGTYE